MKRSALLSSATSLAARRSLHPTSSLAFISYRQVSSSPGSSQTQNKAELSKSTDNAQSNKVQSKKTVAQLDEELRSRLEDKSGEGGVAGIEYEGGRAEGLKSDVKRNMFRVI